jgi:predicted 3-demethylubiquinone-9 3-methyltransferase (glyoxalase superfamily)
LRSETLNSSSTTGGFGPPAPRGFGNQPPIAPHGRVLPAILENNLSTAGGEETGAADDEAADRPARRPPVPPAGFAEPRASSYLAGIGGLTVQTITPFLWFDGKAEEAAKFYTSIFKRSKITSVSRYGEAGPGPKGAAMSVTFQLDGREFVALNGGPQFTFSPAISFFVNCRTQREIDDLWRKLSRGGKKLQCGWLTDKFGVTWQIVPEILGKLLQSKDAKKSANVMKAMLKMIRLDIKKLKKAYERG